MAADKVEASVPASRSSPMNRSGKLKLLAVHGYLQNGAIFSQKTGSLRKGLKSLAEVVYVDAPFVVEAEDEAAAQDAGGVAEGGRSWWQWTDEGEPTRPSLALQYSGVEQGIESLKQALREHRPDGIIGFSQGATATSLLLASLSSMADEDAPQGSSEGAAVPPVKFAVLAGAFLPRDDRYAAMVREARPDLPALFVTGEADALVPPHRSLDLMSCFPRAQRWSHGGGHMVPTCSGEFKKALVAFLQEHGRGGAAAADRADGGR